MNYNLDTKSGMDAAKAWTVNLLARLSDNGTWIVPRSGTFVQVNKPAKTATVTGMFPDPSLARVLRELGFTVTERTV